MYRVVGMVACWLAGLFLVTVFVVKMVQSGNEVDARRQDSYREEGKAAQRAGVPAEANPHTSGTNRQSWLKGWIEAKEAK